MIIDLKNVLKNESAVAQTIFVKVPILIIRNHKNNEEENVFLHTNRSHTDYIINLLLDGTNNINF